MKFFDHDRISYETDEPVLEKGKEYVFQIHVPMNKQILYNGNPAIGRVPMPRVNTERRLHMYPSLRSIQVRFVKTAKFPRRARGYVHVIVTKV